MNNELTPPDKEQRKFILQLFGAVLMFSYGRQLGVREFVIILVALLLCAFVASLSIYVGWVR